MLEPWEMKSRIKRTMISKSLRLKKDEPLWKWVARIGDHYGWSDEEREVVSDVSKISYIHGSKDCQEVF